MKDNAEAVAGPSGHIWVIGCGAMGGALLARWLEAGLAYNNVTIIDPKPTGVPDGFDGAVFADISEASAARPSPQLVVLGIKPQMLAKLAPQWAPYFANKPVLVSMLAGVQCQTLSGFFPECGIVRIMPNTPARVGRGVTALFNHSASQEGADFAHWLAAAAGKALWLKDEAQFDAVTAVSGSGPAYVFRFIEAFAKAAQAEGLDADLAEELALYTLTGAAELAHTSQDSPSRLREQVTSPNGTTQAGLEALDGENGLTNLLIATVKAAADRSRELAAEAAKT